MKLYLCATRLGSLSSCVWKLNFKSNLCLKTFGIVVKQLYRTYNRVVSPYTSLVTNSDIDNGENKHLMSLL